MFKKLLKKVASLKKSVKTTLRRYTTRSDYSRWSDEGQLKAGWDERTQKLAGFVAPGSKVIEFGAGRMVLKGFLPAGCTYTPSDLVDRGTGTIVCDLNGIALPDFGRHDVAVFSGVLEYVNDVPRLVSHLAGTVKAIVASYAVLESHPRNRRAQGWVNDFTEKEFIAMFMAAGFVLMTKDAWKNQMLFKFERR